MVGMAYGLLLFGRTALLSPAFFIRFTPPLLSPEQLVSEESVGLETSDRLG